MVERGEGQTYNEGRINDVKEENLPSLSDHIKSSCIVIRTAGSEVTEQFL